MPKTSMPLRNDTMVFLLALAGIRLSARVADETSRSATRLIGEGSSWVIATIDLGSEGWPPIASGIDSIRCDKSWRHLNAPRGSAWAGGRFLGGSQHGVGRRLHRRSWATTRAVCRW